MDNKPTGAQLQLAAFYGRLREKTAEWKRKVEQFDAALAEMEHGLSRDAQQRAECEPDLARARRSVDMLENSFAFAPAAPKKRPPPAQETPQLERMP